MDEQNFNNLYRLVKLTGGKYVIVEDGKPSAVLMDFSEFENIVAPSIVDRLVDKTSKIEQVNQQITKAQLQDLREEVMQPDFGTVTIDEDELEPEITIEPLEPFNYLT